MLALVKPGLTSSSRARATHQLGAVFAYLPVFRVLGTGDWGLAGLTGGAAAVFPVPSPTPPAPSRFNFKAAGGTRVSSGRCRTSVTSRTGSIFACGLNFKK